MRKGLSIVELLTTLFLVAVLVTLSVVVYNNVRKNADKVVKSSDQRTFLKALEAYKATGGSLSDITGSSSLNSMQKGQALLLLVREAASSSDKNTRGAIGSLISSNAVVVAKTENDNTPRLIVDGTGAIRLANSGSGFIVVASSSVASVPTVEAAVTNAVAIAKAATPSGSRYASNRQYLWNDDDSVVGGPTAGAGNGVEAGTTPPGVVVNIGKLAFVYNDSSSGTGHFNFSQYTNGGSFVEVYVYRQDYSALTLADLGSVGLSFGGANVSASASAATFQVLGTSIVSSGGLSVTGVILRVNQLDSQLKAANTWAAASYKLVASATPSSSGTTNGVQAGSKDWDIVADAVALNAPVITGADSFNQSGDQIRVDAYTTNSTLPNNAVAMDTIDISSRFGLAASLAPSFSQAPPNKVVLISHP